MMAHYVVVDPDFLNPVGVYDVFEDAEKAVVDWTWNGRPIVQLWEGDGYVQEWHLPDEGISLVETDIR